jgi:hypothetical protein
MLLRARGFNADDTHDRLILQAYEDAKTWLTDVSRGSVTIPDAVDSSQSKHFAGPQLRTGTLGGQQITSGIVSRNDGNGRGW